MGKIEELNKLTYKKHMATWEKNLQANQKYFAQAVPMEKSAPVCIIVGAGPSLTDCMSYLQYAKNSLDAFILCVDTAIRPCVRSGVIPDAIISVDAVKDKRHFVGAAKRLPLIAYTTSNPVVLDWHEGEKTFLNNSCCLGGKNSNLMIEGFPCLGSGGNVATVALTYANHIDYKKIVFVGVDLCADIGLSYAAGCLRESLPPEQLGVRELQIAKLWVESFLRDNRKVKLTNITRYGVQIKGADNILL